MKALHTKNKMWSLKRLILGASAVVLTAAIAACSSTGGSGTTMYTGDDWVILPVTNSSGHASAADISQSLLETNLRARNVNIVKTLSGSSIDSSQDSTEENGLGRILDAARQTGARYGVEGTVSQWGRSKLNGRDSRVDIALRVYDLSNNKVVWRSEQESADRIATNTSKVANKTVMALVNGMDLVGGSHPETMAEQTASAVNASVAALSVGGGTNPVASSVGFRKVKLDEDGFSDAVDQDLVGKSLAIFYGAKPPVDELSQFDRLVLEPDNINQEELNALTAHGARAYAYLSVGEVGPTRSYASSVQPDWVLGKNDVWDSTVLDMANPGWTSFLMNRIDVLVQAGYKGLFLDTMDSYQLYATTPEQRQAQETALGQFIAAVTQRHQGIQLIANRGFEVLDQVGPHLEAIAAESLFASWNNESQQYVDVPEGDREWLLGKLNAAKSQYGLDVIAIEYMPPSRREEARKVATSVARLGFTPWVSTPALDYVGVGTMEVMPRKVMMLFDSRVNGLQSNSQVSELIAPLLEYYGYVPVYLDVANEPLPGGELVGQYAGLVTWTSVPFRVPELTKWYKKQLASKLPVAVFGVPVIKVDSDVAKRFGISVNASLHTDSLKPIYESDLIGFEKELPARYQSIGWNVVSKDENNEVFLTLQDKNDVKTDMVITGPWGGVMGSPANASLDLDDTYYWVTDPFVFLEKALKIQKLPMPDITTENGNRLWSSHIDGDALPSWAELPGRKLGAEHIHEKIMIPYKMPHSISIVEGEMTMVEDYADRRERMFDVARRIFAMPSVEIATHTFSHPYHWTDVISQPTSGTLNLKVGDYKYSPEREIGGSARFINENLAPPGKKTELMLWSGNALPQEGALAASEAAGLPNLNGGFTTINKSAPSVTRISPNARTVGKYTQVYAPIMNENVYTNNWLGPFDGFRRVIESFEMTDKPRRFKPLSIYYHFYAGTKLAALRSLVEIYDWSTQQDILPIFASVYAKKVPEYRKAGVSRYLDGSWKVSSLGSIKSIRILDQNTWPELAGSRGIVGSRKLHDGMYVHTDGSNQVVFKTTDTATSQIHLVSANGHVENWQPTVNGISLRVAGHVPVELELSRAASACYIQANGQTIRAKRTDTDTALFTFTNRDTGNVTLNCQA